MNKLNIFSLVLVLLFSTTVIGQITPGNSPCAAGCATTGSYPSSTGNASTGSWGCLGSTPNQNWITVAAASNGTITLQLTQTTTSGGGIDVDFIAFGPFTSLSAGCGSIVPGVTPSVSCSYSASSVETITLPNAQAGQVFIILITNFSGQPGTISITPTSGTVNCSVNFGATATSTPAACGQPNGSVNVTPNGGFAPYTYSWNIPGNPTTASVSNVPPGTYTVTVTSSPNPNTGQTVLPTTANVTVANQTPIFFGSTTPASCPNGANGTATANYNTASFPGLTATYLWSNGQTTQTATGLLPGAHSCTVTLSNGCVGTVNVNVQANQVAYSSTSTIVNCVGGSTGTATATMTPVVGTLSYAWSDPNGQTTQTATNLSAGSYTCTVTSSIGCVGTTTVTVTELPGMTATFPTIQNATCNSGSDGVLTVQVNAGTPNYSYSWDNSSSTSATANDLPAGTHTVTITDANNCVITATETIGEPAPLAINFVSPNMIICPENDTTLVVSGTGGSSPYIFTWTENGTVIGTGASILVDPSTPVTNYCVTLSEVCGSPTTDTCMVAVFPTPIVPSYFPDRTWSCEPGTFEFTNNSVNLNEIQSVLIEYGDGNEEIILGTDSMIHTYINPGKYDITATVTSVYGCIYVDSMPDIVEVIQIPTAEFTMSANPTTIFETTVKMQDNSSPTVVNWQWSSPGSVPSQSTQQNPVFNFPEGVISNYEIELIVETPEGCIDTVYHTLFVNSDILFFAPNAFTPDGDEFNQTWKFSVDGIDIYNFELLIFNRWGQIVWETHDPKSEWDGTYNGEIVPAGSFTWIARVKDIYTDKKKEFKGNINILR